jgi:AAA domain
MSEIEEDYVAPPGAAVATKLLWYGNTPPTPPPYLVDETLPETGLAILGGQFGAAKTFVGADLAAAVIVGGEVAGKPINRRGGVLWLAAEGENEIETRVRAAIIARGGDPNGKHPFARQADGVPCLTDKDALERLRHLAMEAATHMREAFDCDMALIVIDTLSAAAGFDDENSASETQKVMSTVAALARETKTLAVVLDHYGKVADTGVRGSSAKSAAADAILACLGDRDQETGATTNRRMAVTKLRSGPNGRVVAFRLAPTVDGKTCTVEWSDAYDVAADTPAKGNPLPKSLRILKRAFDEALGSFGKTTVPRTGMGEVRAVDQDRVKEEFFRLYPTSAGDARKEAHAKGEAFRRAVKDAVERGVLCAINTGPDLSQTILWTP